MPGPVGPPGMPGRDAICPLQLSEQSEYYFIPKHSFKPANRGKPCDEIILLVFTYSVIDRHLTAIAPDVK